MPTTTVDITIRLEVDDDVRNVNSNVDALEGLARSVGKYIVKGEREVRGEGYTAKISSARLQAIRIEGESYINKANP